MSIIVACQRTSSDIDMNDLDLMVSNVASEFKTLTHDHIIKAIRNGSLGKYGKTYKLCTQEVCIWVRTYAEEMHLTLETPEEMLARKNREADRF